LFSIMKIKQIMEHAITAHPQATKRQLLDLMKKNPNTKVIIIVDKDRQFVGDICENDLFLMVLPNELYENISVEMGFNIEKRFFAETAGAIMRKHGLSCGPDDDILEVALDLAGSEIDEMPVVDNKGRVVGVITEGRILRNLEC
jgi:CBS domain-containing protein